MSITPSNLYPPHPATVRAQSLHLSYDAKNDRIAYPSGRSIIVRPLDPKNGVAKQFTKHIHPTTVATFSPSGNYVASGDESGAVKIWDVTVTGEESFEQPYIKSEFQILSGPIKSIAWDGDSSRVIAVGAGKDKFGHCFTWDSGNSIGEIQGHSDTINAVDIKPQRPYRAATVSDDKALVFYNGPPFKFDKSLRGYHTNTVRAVKFSPDGKFLVSVGSDRTIVIYDGKTGEFVKKVEGAHNGGIFGLSWYKDSSAFVTASADNTLKVWNLDFESTKTYVIDSKVSVENQQVSVIVANDYIVSLSLNGNLNYFKEETNPSFVIPGHQKSLTAIYYGDGLYTGGSDGTIMKWNVKDTIDPIPESVRAHSNYIASITEFGSIVSAGWDDTLKTNSKSLGLSGQPKQLIKNDKELFVLYESKVEVYNSSFEKTNEIDLPFSSSNFDTFSNKLLITNESKNTIEEYTALSHSKTYPALRSPPSLIRISPDGELAAVSDTSGKYTLYKTSDGSVVTTRWAFHTSKVIDAKWTKDSKFLISGGLDSGLFLYSVDKPSKVLKFPLAHQNGVTGLEWISYDGKNGVFVSIGLDGVLKSWDVDLSVY
ncbi:WD40 repeat-like protein [Hyphopichia burtonii NRRL Y-1933]|uniref:WD40 repeat-like protein n=1 Tax=Hyphopichia burtonii NRRL Y-1933 TaxID=984485 RepID=A0A1E4RQA5_9ASCO|nr:WD40 repeat-like protein [Hyphopichia burtonii NRRL Y-1933]ODV69245.1 WD40 repeat-like protein [Hyphopichia burtonii NRRL Y-1933]